MANTTSYMLKFGADATSVTKAITGVNSDIRSMSTQAKNLDTAFRLTGDTSALKGKLTALGNQLSATEAKGKLLKQELANLKSSPGFDANSAKAQKLTNDIAKTESEATKLKAQLATASTSSLDGASSSMGGLTSKIGAGTVAMGTFLGSIASNVVGKSFSLISSNIDGAVKRIDTLNNSTRNFQNMGVKTSVVTKEMENLKSAINGLPTPLDSAVSGVQLLTSSLNGDMPKSVEVFKALNDGILGFGGNSEQVTNTITQLSQAFSNGKIDAETWNSMIDSGLGPTLNALAKTMGKTTGQLKDALSDGSVSVSDFNDAIIKLDKEGGGGIVSLSQIAADGTKGIGTSFSNAKTAVTRGVAEMITGVNNGIASLDITTPLGKIDGIGSIITQLGTVVEKTFDGMAGAIVPTFKLISQGVSALNPVFQAYGSFLEAYYSAVGNVVKTLYNNVKSFDFSSVLDDFHMPDLDFTPLINLAQQIIPSIQAALSGLDFSGLQNLAGGVIAGVIGAFQNLFNIVTPAIQPLITAIGGLGDAFQPMLGALSNLWNALQPIVSVLGGVLMVALAGVGAVIGGVLLVGIKALTATIQVLSGVFQALAPVINVIAAVISNIIPMFQDLATVAVSLGSTIGQVFSAMISTVSSWFGSVSSFFSSIGSAFGSLGSLFSSVGSSISGAFSSVGNTFANIVSKLLGLFANMGSGFQSVGGIFSSVGSSIGGVASNIVGFFSGIGGRIVSGFGDVGGRIAGLFSGVVGRIGSMFSGVGEIGVNIVRGIQNGITGAIGGLVSTAADMAKQALNSAKKALGIHSPSRVFRDEVGKYITQGIGVGMEKETGYLANSSDAVKNSLLSDWQNVNLNTSLASGINSTSQGDLTASTGTNNVFNITANTKADASAIASEIKTVLRQNGISAR